MFATKKQLASASLNDQAIDSIIALKQKLFHLPLDFSTLTIEKMQTYLADIEKIFHATYDQIAALSNTPDAISFATVVQPLIDLDILTQKAVALMTIPRYVHPEQDIRDYSVTTLKNLSKLEVDCKQREDVFQVCRQYEMNAFQHERSSLHPEEVRCFEHLMRAYKRDGLYITDPAIRAEIARIKIRLSECCVQFKQNLSEDDTQFIMSKDELNGLPEDWFTDSNRVAPDQYKVTLRYSDVFPVLDMATSHETRKKIFTAFDSRGGEKNVALLKEALILRQQLASLLGYKTFADYATEVKMAKDGATVKDFLDEMNEKFTPVLEKYLSDLTAFAREKENDPTLTLEVSDMRYYTRLFQESTCQINLEDVRQYFPIKTVIDGTLKIYQQILGLKFIPIESKTVWHPDVYTFGVIDAKTETPMGKFHLDLYSRTGKYSHAAVTDLMTGCDISRFTGVANDRQISVGLMMCNFAKDTNIPFKDMVTFFHEFGHVMHHICSRTKLSDMNGFHVERDFVEAPSQMLENWCFEPEALKLLSAHTTTGEPLPLDIAKKMKKFDVLDAGYHYKRQLTYAYFDYYLHTASAKDLEKLDLNTFYQTLLHKQVKLPYVENTCFPATFGHLMGGYEAGYYGYMFAKVYSADMYMTVFKKDPLNPDNGKRYREEILAPGATKDAMVLLQNFLGRAPNVDAFLEHYELIDTTQAPIAKRRRL